LPDFEYLMSIFGEEFCASITKKRIHRPNAQSDNVKLMNPAPVNICFLSQKKPCFFRDEDPKGLHPDVSIKD